MIKTYEDIIPKTSQKRLYDLIDSSTFSWYITKNSSYSPDISVPDFWNNIPTIGYVKTIYAYGEIYTPEMMPWCLQILDTVLDKEGIEMKELLRIQINLLYQNVDKNYNENHWTSAHTDQDFEHNVLLYYVNDSDGDTWLFNEKRGDEFDKFTVKNRIQPKQGSCILFDGKYFHSASNPINSNKRIAINFNFR